MERKKLHRIVGLLVLAAVVIIGLPLLTGRNDQPTSRVLSMEAPLFPDSDSPPAGANPPETKQPETALPAPEAVPEAAPAVTPPVVEDSPQKTEDKSAPAAAPLPAEEKSALPAAPAALPDSTVSGGSSPAATGDSASATSFKKSPVLNPSTVLNPSPGNAWAVQMGNFHNHDNAVRLVNRLRAGGFHAFMREIQGRHGIKSTRVYVGPAPRQVLARRLSGDIQDQLNIEGIVVNYPSFST